MGQHGPAWASMGQHGPAWASMGQRDVTMPSRPGADLVLVEPNLARGGLEAGLNRPARAGNLDKGGKFCALRRERQIKDQLIRLLRRPPDQERFLPALTSAPDRDTRPVIQARTRGPVAGAQPRPAPLSTSVAQSPTGRRPRRCAEGTVST